MALREPPVKTAAEEAAAAAARAWNDPGPVPEYHRAAQLRLHQEWPTLAAAVEQLAALERPVE